MTDRLQIVSKSVEKGETTGNFVSKVLNQPIHKGIPYFDDPEEGRLWQ